MQKNLVVSKKSAIFVVEKETNKNTSTMKKFDIIVEYNSLASELRSAIDNYNAITGEDYTRRFTNNIFYVMDSSRCMAWGKDELKRYLANRQHLIATCKRDTKVYQKTKDMKSTEEGRNFIKSLEDTREKLQKELDNVCETFRTDFDRLLSTVGLDKWCSNPKRSQVIPSFHTIYFDIYHTEQKWANLHISIDRKNCKWVMSVNCGLRGSNDINDRTEQYQQFKAYVTICDNADTFQAWMENTYCELAHMAYDLMNRIDQLDEDIKYPYDAWMRTF